MTTRSRSWALFTLTLAGAAALALPAPPARADVTVGQKTSMSLAGMDIDIDSIERTTVDRQRNDSTVHCHGLLALFCHNVEGGSIVRLDKQVEWQLQPQKKRYTEHLFPTAEQRAEAQQQFDAAMEEMKKCPMPQSQNASRSAPDTTQCQLSSPVLNVTGTDEHATILGHDARKTSVVLSQTCTDTKTGDVCEIDYGFETWLTTEAIAGSDERSAFVRKYLQTQGLDPNNPQLQHTVQQFMAPYADALKQLRSKAADLKGYPLRTTFYMAFGGPHCGKAKEAAQQQQQASSGSPFSMHSLATNALAGGLSGLFHHGASAINTGSAGGAAASGAANEAAEPAASAAANSVTAQSSSSDAPAPAAPAPLPGSLVRVVSLITETTSIDTSSIPSDQFEIPADWTLEPQKQVASNTPKCPTAGR